MGICLRDSTSGTNGGMYVSIVFASHRVPSRPSRNAMARFQHPTDMEAEVDGGPVFFGYKFRHSGVRYKLGVCIITGDIVWINGPYPCGLFNDLQIFRLSLKSFLEPNERAEADDGYAGESPLKTVTPSMIGRRVDQVSMKYRVAQRHETCNRRFKQWGCTLSASGILLRSMVIACVLLLC